MTQFPAPNLDDRNFRQLLAAVKDYISQDPRIAQQWTDWSPSDPGVILLELFAFLTDVMIYRINRIPEKVYIELLRIIGLKRFPPAAAQVRLQFSREAADNTAITIPAGTQVTLARSGASGEPPTFITFKPTTIEAGATTAEAAAFPVEIVEAELVGIASGAAGQSFVVKRPPILAPIEQDSGVVVGVQVPKDRSLPRSADARTYDGKTFRLWQEVENFANLSENRFVYVLDRAAGRITFPPAVEKAEITAQADDQPAALGEVPPNGAEIRVWYRRGGGSTGNVVAGKLTSIKAPAIRGVKVTNPQASVGGRDIEPMENALLRGPLYMYTLERAVIARDFEQIAVKFGVARARAVTALDLWAHAHPGTVEVSLVPDVPYDKRLPAPGEDVPTELHAMLATPPPGLRETVERELRSRQPLGTTSNAKWARYKTVNVEARVVIRREENADAVEARVRERLYGVINPLPNPHSPTGWVFGQALRISHIFDAGLVEPGVRWVDQVKLTVGEAPNTAVRTLIRDPWYPSTVYAGSANKLFRTSNNGDGWELIKTLPADQLITNIQVNPFIPGWIAVISAVKTNGRAFIYFTADAGETWLVPDEQANNADFPIRDAAWTVRDENKPMLLLATERGIFELAPGSTLNPISLNNTVPPQGYWSIVVHKFGNEMVVAVAAQNQKGIYVSYKNGEANSYRKLTQKDNLEKTDVQELAVQSDGARAYLWAGTTAELGGVDPGKGLYRYELRPNNVDDPIGWVQYGDGWTGGTCTEIAFRGSVVLASTNRAGVLRLDLNEKRPEGAPDPWKPTWKVSTRASAGLPIRSDRPREGQIELRQLDTVTIATDGKYIITGGDDGIFRAIFAPAPPTTGTEYTMVSKATYINEPVTIPQHWLLVSGQHTIKVVTDDEAIRD